MSDLTKLPKGAIAIDRGPHDAVIILDGTYAATVPKRLADAIEALQKTEQSECVTCEEIKTGGILAEAYCAKHPKQAFGSPTLCGHRNPNRLDVMMECSRPKGHTDRHEAHVHAAGCYVEDWI